MPMNIFHLFETKQKGKQIIIEGLQSKFVQVIIGIHFVKCFLTQDMASKKRCEFT